MRQSDANTNARLDTLPAGALPAETPESADVAHVSQPAVADVAPSQPDHAFTPATVTAETMRLLMHKDALLMRCGH